LTSTLLSTNNGKANNRNAGDHILHLALQQKCDCDVVRYLMSFISTTPSLSLRRKDQHGHFPLHIAILNNRGWNLPAGAAASSLPSSESLATSQKHSDAYLVKLDQNNNYVHVNSNNDLLHSSVTSSSGNHTHTHAHHAHHFAQEVSQMLCDICNESIGNTKKKSSTSLSPVLFKHSSGKTSFQLAIENASPEGCVQTPLHYICVCPFIMTHLLVAFFHNIVKLFFFLCFFNNLKTIDTHIYYIYLFTKTFCCTC
jgi:hypothetical protein